MREGHIAVVGGGIAGASVAYHLSERTDRGITVYERGGLAGETTAKSAAFFGRYGSDLERRLKRYGMGLYNAFLASPRAEPRHDLLGRLRVATTDAGAAELADRVERARADQLVEYLPADRIHASVLLPELDPDGVAGAAYRPGVGYHPPGELAREFVARARERGATVETGSRVDEVVVVDDQVWEVVVDSAAGTEVARPAAVVLAAGPWNPHVAREAGLDLPVFHSLAPILRLAREDDPPQALPIVSHVESGVYARGHGRDAVLVGHHPTAPDPDRTYDPDAIDERVPDDLREEMRRVVGELVPAIGHAPVVEEWVGVRSHTPDGHPIVGWTGVEGLAVVAFNSSGVQLAPAAGRIVARQLVDADATEHYQSVSIARFDGHDDRRFSV